MSSKSTIREIEDILREARKEFRRFSTAEAKRIGNLIGVNWSKIPLGEFRAGLAVELEHGSSDPQTNVTNNDLIKTGKIALAHLKEDPKYYTRLRRAGVKDVPSTT